MNKRLSEKIKYNKSITRYLEELKVIAGRHVYAKELDSLEHVEIVKEKSVDLSRNGCRTFEIPFENKKEEFFLSYVKKMTGLNSNPIYVRLDKGFDCGFLKVSCLEDINFEFPFDFDDSGFVSFISCDFEDKLSIDFWEEYDGSRVLKVEVCGKNWSKIDYKQ